MKKLKYKKVSKLERIEKDRHGREIPIYRVKKEALKIGEKK